MKLFLFSLIFLFIFPQLSFAQKGIVKIKSNYSVNKTAEKFESIIKNKGFTIFNRIDHQKNALGVNLDIRPTQVIIFGNPKVGTKLMECAQSIAIDLPQKVLVWQDINNNVWLSYNNPKYLKKRHKIKGCDAVLKKIAKALNMLAQAAAK